MSSPVPEGWEQRPIGELVTLQYGKSPKEVIDDDGEYPIIGTGGITGYAKSYLHEGGTTVVGRKGTINNPSYVDEKFWAIDTTYYAEKYTQSEPKWFFYNLQNTDLSKYNEASGVPSLNRDTLYSVSLKVPPLPEQKKIASILTSVDKVIEKTESQIAKLQDLKTGMMQELLQQGIGHTEFKDSPVGRIPVRWEVSRISDIVTKVGSGITPKGGSNSYVQTGIPLIRSQNVYSDGLRLSGVSCITQEQHEKMANSKLQPNDVLLNITGASIGRCYFLPNDFIEGNVNQHVCIIRLKKERAHHVFISLILNSEFGQRQIMRLQAGGNREGLNFQQIREIKVPLPTYLEQSKISEIVQSISGKIENCRRKLQSTNALKKSLMQDLLTGKVRVNTD